jgi:hypothetical protein
MRETANCANRTNQSGGGSVCLCSQLKNFHVFPHFFCVFFLFFAEKLDVFAVLWYTDKWSSDGAENRKPRKFSRFSKERVYGKEQKKAADCGGFGMVLASWGGGILFSGCDQIQELLGMGGDEEPKPAPAAPVNPPAPEEDNTPPPLPLESDADTVVNDE